MRTDLPTLHSASISDGILLAFPHMVAVMNNRATITSKEGRQWTRDAKFLEMIEWTRTAGREEISSLTDGGKGSQTHIGMVYRILTSPWESETLAWGCFGVMYRALMS